jgi:hypothetical protein
VHRAATPLELLYDLTFVVAFGAAADDLAHYLAEGHFGAAVGGFGLAAFCRAGLDFATCDGQSRCMPSWLSWLLFIIFILVFIVPNPVKAGVFFGDRINSIVVFFRSMGAAVGA